MSNFKQGDSTTMTFTLSEPLGVKDCKVGFYNDRNNLLYQFNFSDDGVLSIDDTHYSVTLSHEITKRFVGEVSIHLTVFSDEFSNSGERCVVTYWDKEGNSKLI